MASASVSQVLRLFTILHLVATRRPEKRLGRQHLAHACDCSTRTVGRDLALLQSANIPLTYNATERTFCLPEKTWCLSFQVMTQADALGLALVEGLLARDDAALPFLCQLHTTLAKAGIGLSPALRLLRDSAATALTEVGGVARDYSQAPLRTLLLAAARKETVEILYESRSSGVVKNRKVDPYRLDRRDGRYLEMQAWCHEHREVRTFALDRVREARRLEQTFIVRPWESSDAGVVGGLRGGKPIVVEVRFDPVVAAFARERRWPFEATFTLTPEGGVLLHGVVQGVEGIVRELLSWRRHAVVLGGPELRARMQEEIQAMSRHYTEEGS